ncbi:Radical SAM domain protein [Desulfarculus baarsii DSM 2075]|uniref:Cyclic dehypoxanthine futalosine synthase n=1 Tax=Desulfarculus baarsii (strain ATCC 33931 / DSM 2075 / LMG 7858 / VKM B-1802 / 2st14) TaxID=644282 RepID=E1QJ16_DESB2|nr:radical SAM protein [Desulfarculus baarsii]ADK85559.1 Radical SAM domain protein [Desulfarculus baarsii DSM 2075]
MAQAQSRLSLLDQALEAAASGARLSDDQALALLLEAPPHELAVLAHRARLAKNPAMIVTYAVDRNINTTNVCLSGCRFCAFFRPPGAPGGYVLSPEEIDRKIAETIALGGTQILVQGGLHPEIGVEETCRQIRRIKKNFNIHVHGLSPPEVVHMAAVDGMDIDQALDRLIAAGLGSIPGGGAEILVDSVRRRIAPGKCSGRQWLEVMARAHAKGLFTTATMMFGSLDGPAERIGHMALLRALQDQSLARGRGCFTAFIPWTFQPANTALAHLTPLTAVDYLRTLAVSRLYLDNFAHVQASWVTQGAKIAQLALLHGADDLGSTMIEENVVAAAGACFRLDRAEMIRLADDLGYQARQRDTLYRLL